MAASTTYTLSANVAEIEAGKPVTLTITPDGDGPASDTTVTFSDGGKGGTFTPASVTITKDTKTAVTATYTPATAQGGTTVSLTSTNNQSLADPAAVSLKIDVPPTVPGKPTISLSVASGTLTATVVAPASDGGAAITGYQIKYGTKSGGETTTGPALVNPGSAEISGLTNGTEYFVTVTATNSVGSTTSDEVSATPIGAPGKATVTVVAEPSALKVTVITPEDTGGADISAFNVRYGTESGGETVAGGSLVSPGELYIRNLTNNQTYYVVVDTVTAGGTTPSDEVQGIPSGDVSGPAANVVAGDGAIVVTIEEGATVNGNPATEFYIYAGKAPGIDNQDLKTVLREPGTFIITGVDNNIDYFVSVGATDGITQAFSYDIKVTPVKTFTPDQAAEQAVTDAFTLYQTAASVESPTAEQLQDAALALQTAIHLAIKTQTKSVLDIVYAFYLAHQADTLAPSLVAQEVALLSGYEAYVITTYLFYFGWFANKSSGDLNRNLLSNHGINIYATLHYLETKTK